MDIRKLTPVEYRAADILDSFSFALPVPEETKEKAGAPQYRPERWGYFDDKGQMAATLVNHDLPIWFDGGIAPARGVGGVASDPVSRGEGHVRVLFSRVLQADHSDGKLFSVLYPFSHAFYRKFGYEVCYEHRTASFPLKALERFREGDPPQARLIRPEDGTQALQPLYTALARRYNFTVARGEAAWARLRIGDPYKAERYCYALSRGGLDVAFVVFSFRQGETQFIQTLCVHNYGFVDESGFFDLMCFLHRYTAFAQTTELPMPEDFPLCSLLSEAGGVRYLFGAKPMARVLHVENVLKAMHHPKEDGEYTLYVEDSFLPENEGCCRVRYAKDGGVAVSRCKGEADLRLSVQTLAQLTLGFLKLQDALYKPDVTVTGNRETLEKVFVQKVKFLLDWY